MNLKTTKIRAVLFDLDGTLLDTAQDLVVALNVIRKDFGLPELLISAVKPFISAGSKAILDTFLSIRELDQEYAAIRQRLFELYAKECTKNTIPFPGIHEVLLQLQLKSITWGIVTNRITSHTDLLMRAMTFDPLPACIVCADTLQKAKPDPEPIIHACQLLNLQPRECVYVGDAITDIQAAKAAGMKSIAALYGYISQRDDPSQWQADGYIEKPIELIDWIQAENTI